jgi:16S rRNA G966 N2-methylase RsmD
MALEAWSRGASVCVVERQRRAFDDIRTRAASLGVSGPAWELRFGDVLSMAHTLGSFHGVFADPPWADPVEPILSALAPLTQQWLVLEADAERKIPEVVGHLRMDRVRTYGRTAFWVFRGESVE